MSSNPQRNPKLLLGLFVTALSLLTTSCATRLNQALSRLPQTEAYSKPLSSYSVNEVVTVAKPLYKKIELHPDAIFVFDGSKLDYPMTYTLNSTSTKSEYSTVIALEHNGATLTGGHSSLTTGTIQNGTFVPH